MKTFFQRLLFLFALLGLISTASAAADLEVDTPAISTLKKSMQDRHSQLAAFYASGAVGLTRDGAIQLRDASSVPLAQRQTANSLVTAENQDRAALYKEMARANGKPEWEPEIRSTFAQRWIEKAQPGWYYQNTGGSWIKK